MSLWLIHAHLTPLVRCVDVLDFPGLTAPSSQVMPPPSPPKMAANLPEGECCGCWIEFFDFARFTLFSSAVVVIRVQSIYCAFADAFSKFPPNPPFQPSPQGKCCLVMVIVGCSCRWLVFLCHCGLPTPAHLTPFVRCVDVLDSPALTAPSSQVGLPQSPAKPAANMAEGECCACWIELKICTSFPAQLLLWLSFNVILLFIICRPRGNLFQVPGPTRPTKATR